MPSGQERIGAQLLHLRQLSGMGQKVVAHRTGISISHVSLIEHGQRSASVNVLCAMAQAVGGELVVREAAL